MDIPQFVLPIHLFMDTWIVSAFWVLWMANVCTCSYLSTYFQFLRGIYLGVELLGHRVILCLMFWGTTNLFSTPFFCISILQYISENFCLSTIILCPLNKTSDMYLRAAVMSHSSLNLQNLGQGFPEKVSTHVYGIGLTIQRLYTVLSLRKKWCMWEGFEYECWATWR